MHYPLLLLFLLLLLLLLFVVVFIDSADLEGLNDNIYTLDANHTVVNISLMVINDDEFEVTERFPVHLIFADGLSNRIILAPAKTEIIIEDEDSEYYISSYK